MNTSKKPSRALPRLRVDEWTMGNGQCPDCEGFNPNLRSWKVQCEKLGHHRKCPRATAIEELGGEVQWLHKNKTPERLEHIRRCNDISTPEGRMNADFKEVHARVLREILGKLAP